MREIKRLGSGIAAICILGTTLTQAQTVNNWRGDATGADWQDQYKWDKNHPPREGEAAYFREENSVVNVNSTIQLNNGMHLYGNELSLQGNGNINMWSRVPHLRTVNIPATSKGFANLTLNDNISLNGRVALSAKGFATGASKGSITLSDRSNVTGELAIGNAGHGTGQVFVKENSTYRITGLELATEAKNGGSAEIHVLGGTVRIETKDNPFDAFLADASRKIIIGDTGTVRFEYEMEVDQKKKAIKDMIMQERILAAPGCRITLPVIMNKMVIVRAEDDRNDTELKTQADLLAAIDAISENSTALGNNQPKGLANLLANMSDSQSAAAALPTTTAAPTVAKSTSKPRMAGYIVFFGVVLFALRRPSEEDEKS